MIIRIPLKRYYDIVDYCHTNIAPRSYHLHNRIGGKGWSVYQTYKPINPDNWKRQHSVWCLDINDEHQATIIQLKYGIE
jgi:hypothetical protein